MESTAINTVYVVMHVFSKMPLTTDDEASLNHGYLWNVYQREDDAKKAIKRLNEDCDKSLDKFVIIETLLL